jgi:glycine dehydrogenase subunit 1
MAIYRHPDCRLTTDSPRQDGKSPMPYTINTPRDQQEMLEAIGVESLDELFSMVPEEIRLGGDLNIPPAMSEMEMTRHMAVLAEKNQSTADNVCFLGAGSYDHFVPAVVDFVASRSEFYTSYTPYQPEVSQGNLQATFEYQTLITQLTGMDVSNASLYDGGSAATEAVLMSMAATRRYGRVVTVDTVHPEYRQILQTYLANVDTELVTVAAPDGRINVQRLAEQLTGETACVLIQHPNFFGSLEDVEQIAQAAHDVGALLIVAVDPMSLGLLKRPGDLGADIVVAEGQSLGTPMLYGGPYLGILACREKFVRRMPGRICGQTVDRRGNRCFVLTLQTREQHIRREKATSNICTNQGLFALRASVYLALMGPQGMRDLGNLCLQKAHHAAERLCQSDRFELAFEAPTFKEFVVRDLDNDVEDLLAHAASQGVFAGVPLGKWYPDLADCFLVAVTEKRTLEDIDRLVSSLTANSRKAAASYA